MKATLKELAKILARSLLFKIVGVVFLSCVLLVSIVRVSGFPVTSGELNQFIRDYVVSHPEILVEAYETLQERSQLADDGSIGRALYESDSPSFGSGDIVIVEFFDYNCGYCRRASSSLRDVLPDESDVRIIYKEFPILGDGSNFAARAALSSIVQGRYHDFHVALMGSSRSLDEARVLGIAEEIGLDIDLLLSGMGSESISSMLASNRALADSLDIRGTPAFIIGGEIFRGYLSPSALRKQIGLVRKRLRS